MRILQLTSLLTVACTGTPYPQIEDTEIADTTGADTESESDPPGETDPPVDTFDPRPTTDGPASWGPGFTNISEPLRRTDAMGVFAGSSQDRAAPQLTSGIFADMDGDGLPELIFGNSDYATPTPAPRETRVFRYMDQALVRAPELETQLDPFREAPYGALDLDGDGWTDLLYADAPLRYAIAWGGPEGFSETDRLIAEPLLNNRFVGAVGLVDLDQDGWLDLLLGERACGSTALPLLRVGPRLWEPRPDLATDSTEHVQVDGVLPVQVPGGRPVHLMVGFACFNADAHPGFYREQAPDSLGVPQLVAEDPTPPDASWKLDPSSAGLPLSTRTPMGAATTDLDADGLMDIVVTVGSPLQVVLKGTADGRFADASEGAALRVPESSGVPEFPWGVATPDLDGDGLPDVVMSSGDDWSSYLFGRGAVMKNRAWRNIGQMQFEEITDSLGLGSAPGNFHALVTGDLDRDGDADLIMGGFGHQPQIWRNDIDTGWGHAALTLHGTTSNHLGAGAIVRVEVDGLPTRTAQFPDQANPIGLPEPLLFVGTGTSETLDRVEVTWPTGIRQVYEDLSAGAVHTLEEAPTVELLDGRLAPADGTATLRVRITARDLHGAAVPTAVVDLQLGGPNLSITPLVADGDGFLATLTAPSAPGVTRLSVSIDGVALGVAPKIWWTEPPPPED